MDEDPPDLPCAVFAIGGLGPGGSETQLVEIVVRLHAKDLRAHVVVGQADQGSRLDRLRAAGIPVTELGYPRKRGFRFAARFWWRYFWTLRHIRPDVAYAWLEETSLFVVPCCRVLGIPVVVARRNVSGAQLEAKPLIGKIVRRVERGANVVTANSQAVLNVAQDRGIASARLCLIPNALPDRAPKQPPSAPPVRIGYLARMRPEKGHFRFLRVLARLPDGLDWLALLGGDGDLEEALRLEADRLNIASRVRFCGEVADGGAFWDSCNIAVLMSEHEGSPNSLIEASRADRPLLATAVGGTPEVVSERGGYLVEPGDESEAAELLARLIEDPQRRAKMGSEARRYVMERHDPEKAAQLHLSAVQRALASRKRPSLIVLAAAIMAAVAVASGPFWTTVIAPSAPAFTVGRVALAIAVVTTAIALARRRPTIPRPMLLASAGMLGLFAVSALSAAGRGCDCDGALVSMGEVFSLTLTCAGVALLWTRARLAIVVAASIAGVIAALLALAGIDDVRTMVEPTGRIAGGDRLGGTFHNPNYLAQVVAIGLAASAVALRTRSRKLLLALCLILAALAYVLLATYSRGGLIALAAGVLAALLVEQASWRRRIVVGFASVAVLILGAMLFTSAFQDARKDAQFGAKLQQGSVDKSGWDARAQGPIPAGPSHMSNTSGGALKVAPSGPGQGVSYPLPPLQSGADYSASVLISTSNETSTTVMVRLQDNFVLTDGVTRSQVIASQSERIDVKLTPTLRIADPRIYIWQEGATADLRVQRVALGGPGGWPKEANLRLEGEIDLEQKLEDRFIDSRREAIGYAVNAFSEEPFFGIGWQRFPDYAEENGKFGELATHNDYLRIAAELGLAGLFFLTVIAGGVGWALARAVQDDLRVPIFAVVATGAVALVFINGLSVPAIMSGFAGVLGILLGGSRENSI